MSVDALSGRILVTGATGLVGHALIDELRARGCAQVVAPSRADCDLCDEAAVNRLIAQEQPDLVFHLAARVSGIMGNINNAAAAFVDNIRINTNIIEAAHKAGASKIVAMGTTATYSDMAPLPMREDDIWIGPPHESEAAYGHAKRAMLAQLDAYHKQYGLRFAYCISTNLYGPNDKFDEHFGHVMPSLISKFYRAVKEGSNVTVWGDGSPQRDFLYSGDAAKALCLIAARGEGAINLATGRFVCIRDLVETLVDVTGFKGEVIWDTSKPNGQILRSYSIERLTGLGFAPGHDLRSGVEKTYGWFVENVACVRR
jgi:GDP-L-fucose synthase